MFLEKSFEFRLYDKSGIFMATLMLNLSKADGIMKEWGGK